MTTGALTRRGQGAAMVRARPMPVLRALMAQTPVLAVLTGVPGIAAALDRERDLATALLAPTILLAMIALRARSRGVDDDLRQIEAIAALALVFILAALLTLPAYMVLGLPFVDALFEGFSGITTTGLSAARNAETWPVSAHLLRGWAQWCGGVVMAVAGVALLMGAGRAVQVMGRQSVDKGGYLASSRNAARTILIGYSALTAIGIAGALALIPGWWEGPVIALSAVSTGGFTPRDSSLAEYSLGAQSFIMALCVAGSLSLVFYAHAWRQGLRDALRAHTVLLTLALIAASTCTYVLIHGFLQGWEPESLIAGALNQVSAHTTAGFSTGPISPVNPAILVLLFAMMMGGDVGSTTGGIKTARIATMGKMIALILLRMRLPDRAVSHLKISGHRADSETILFGTALLAIYLLALALFWLALFIAGHPPLASMFDAVSALSGVGQSAGVIGPDLAWQLKLMTMFAMLLGRLEFFAVIALLLPSTWLSRKSGS
jgi:trk system potassium uptake protein TrkH